MTKQFVPDLQEAINYADDGLNDSIMKAHQEGQRHAASVLMPEIERLKELNRKLANHNADYADKITQLEKALDLAVSALRKSVEYHFYGDYAGAGACLMCDMGESGRVKDENGHDMGCIYGCHKRILAEIERIRK